LQHGPVLDPLNGSDSGLDSDGDGLSNLSEYQQRSDPNDRESPGLTRLVETSPTRGENGVAVSRETIFRFSRPLAESTSLTANVAYAEAAGRRLLARSELSQDRKRVTLF
jgi:hypothetical protein